MKLRLGWWRALEVQIGELVMGKAKEAEEGELISHLYFYYFLYFFHVLIFLLAFTLPLTDSSFLCPLYSHSILLFYLFRFSCLSFLFYRNSKTWFTIQNCDYVFSTGNSLMRRHSYKTCILQSRDVTPCKSAIRTGVLILHHSLPRVLKSNGQNGRGKRKHISCIWGLETGGCCQTRASFQWNCHYIFMHQMKAPNYAYFHPTKL